MSMLNEMEATCHVCKRPVLNNQAIIVLLDTRCLMVHKGNCYLDWHGMTDQEKLASVGIPPTNTLCHGADLSHPLGLPERVPDTDGRENIALKDALRFLKQEGK